MTQFREPPESADASALEAIVAGVLAAADVDAAVETACSDHPAHASGIRRSIGELKRLGMLAEPAAGAEVGPDSIGGYRLVEVLGRGGMGVVYRAADPTLGRDVALKVLRPELLHFADSRERFRREVDAVARLQHRGIVQVHSAGEADGAPFFTMELVDGTSLAATIAAVRGRPFGSLCGSHLIDTRAARADASSDATQLAEDWIEACLQICRAVAEALQHAHERGVFHRDVKPSNVLVDRHGRARLLDFGLARLESAQDLTRSAAMLGSLPYMPPEQIEGRLDQAGPQQDVYSLGVTMYELLTQQSPFLAATPEQTHQRVVAADPQRPRAINARIASDVETVCATAMDPDPGRRYATARAFAEDLGRLLEHRPIVARPPGPFLRARRFAQRHTTATVTATLGVLLLVASVLAAIGARRAESVERAGRVQLIDANLQFVSEFLDGLRRIPGSTEVRIELMQRAADHLAELEQEVTDDPRRLGAIAAAYLDLADVLGNPQRMNAGRREEARARYAHVIELAARVQASMPVGAALLRARAWRNGSQIERFEGGLDRAIELQRRAADALGAHLVDDPRSQDERAVEALYLNCQSQLASMAGSKGDHEAALRGFEAVRARHELRAARDPEDEGAAYALARSKAICSIARYMLGQHARAADEMAEFVAVLDARLARDPQNAQLLLERLTRGQQLTEFQIKAGRFAPAIALCNEDLARCEQLIEVDAENVRWPSIRLHLLYNCGWAHQRRAEQAMDGGERSAAAAEDLRAARAFLQRALDLCRTLKAAGRVNATVREEPIAGRLAAVEELLRDG